MKRSLFLLISLMAGGCGDTNLNRYLFEHDTKSFEELFQRAEHAYNKGNFAEAISLAGAAKQKNPLDERNLLLLGYVNLALSGMDVLDIIGKSMEAGSAEGDLSYFNLLGGILNFNNTHLESLGTVNASDMEQFKDFNLVVPQNSTDLRANPPIEQLRLVNEALSVICPYTPSSLRKVSEYDQRLNCSETLTPKNPALVAYLMTFSYLAEATIFYEVLNYKNPDLEQSNLLSRYAQIEDLPTTPQNLQYYTEFSKNVLDVFQPGEVNSLLNAVVDDLNKATAVLASLPSVPKSVSEALLELTKNIEELSGTANTGNEELSKAAGLQAQITSGIAENLENNIHNYKQENPEADITPYCEEYVKITGQDASFDACQ